MIAILLLGYSKDASAEQTDPLPQKTEKRSVFPEDCWGVYSWCSWNPVKNNRKNAPLIKGGPIIMRWDKLEPQPGRYLFDQFLKARLQAAVDNNFYTFVMIWISPRTPQWVFESGVPKVRTTKTMTPTRKERNGAFPYYLEKRFIRYLHRLIDAFGDYIRNLPPELRKRILFVQSAEGSTGDGWGYKGKPLDKRYIITREAWRQYRIGVWNAYRNAFQSDGFFLPILVNNDANSEVEYDYLLKHMGIIGLKNGMFSHGYHISDTQSRLERWNRFKQQVLAQGKGFFSRGEMDGEWKICGWSKKNPEQALYWSAIFATHCGLDMWNIPSEACVGFKYKDAIRFFNKYAGKHDPATAPGAFCALRKGLDASDTTAYPETRFGKATKKNVSRYIKIAAAYKKWGAYQGDPDKATGGGMKNRQRNDYNDVGWGILPGNYFRFLEQIDPEGTSIGWWHVGPPRSIYGRFARSFDHRRGKTEMFFKLDEHFFPDRSQPHTVRVRIIYLDKGKGTWSLNYNDQNRKKEAIRVTCNDTGKWIEKNITIEHALFSSGLEKGSDLTLRYLGGDDTVFHLIELER